jgi:hypothetical protein
MIRIAGALCLLLSMVEAGYGQDEVIQPGRDWATPGEERGWFAPTTPADLGEYLNGLAESFDVVTLDTLAWVDGGSVEPDSALPVLLAGLRKSAPANGQRLRVLVVAGQRGEDLSGTEVSLQIIRELVLGEIGALLDELEIAFVPAANPWGLLWWIPDEPSGVDLTRDHSLLLSPATRGIHDLVTRWRPHLVVELREIGPSLYRVQAGLPKHPNVDPDLTSYGRFYLLPHVANELARANVTFREYVSVEPESEGLGTPLLGADALPAGSFLSPGQLGADRAGNSLSLAGSLSIMLGVASMGGVDGLPERVQLLYQSVGYLLEVAAAQAEGLLKWVDQAPPALSLRHRYEVDEQKPDLVWLVWNDRGQIVQQTTDRWRSIVRRTLVLPLPAGWLIEPSGREWAELVASHGFEVEHLSRDEDVEVGSYPVGVIATLPPDLGADLPLDSAPDGSNLLVRGERKFPQGAWLVRADQPGARLLFTLIEPWSQDAPLGSESVHGATTGAQSPGKPGVYPVHRIEAVTSLGSLRTEPAELGATQAGPAN